VDDLLQHVAEDGGEPLSIGRVIQIERHEVPAHEFSSDALIVLARLRRAERDAPVVEQRVDLAHRRRRQLVGKQPHHSRGKGSHGISLCVGEGRSTTVLAASSPSSPSAGGEPRHAAITVPSRARLGHDVHVVGQQCP